MAAKSVRVSGKRPLVPFTRKLVLNQWMLSLFNVRSFEDIAEFLRDESLEGLDENNIHYFHHALIAHRFNLPQLPRELLLEYDQNIVKHTQRLNERRTTRGDEPIVWKYFQYLGLLFCEIYLDRYFRDPTALMNELNKQVAAFNAHKPEPDRLSNFKDSLDATQQLNKLAFWMATGSGKTLLMHANILQYAHAVRQHGRQHELNRIILLTPNEGLSQQHLREFETAGIHAELFDKDARSLFSAEAVEILEVTRLREQMGERTVAIEAFEGNNLVLVDEGHRGTSGGEKGAWMRARSALCQRGFSFEYSATFSQAVKGSAELTDLYAKSTLFDYSYRHFYADGFGKDYQILNLDEKTERNHLDLYLVACLLSFFQQQRLYRERSDAFRPFNIETPLWVFVGGRVTATLAKRDASDIVEILGFLKRFLGDRSGSIHRIKRILGQGLVATDGKDLFAGHFAYLNTCGLSPSAIFDETLATLFNAPAGGQLYVENLKGVKGEVALRVGMENEVFGVINVGDDGKLVRLCDLNGIAVREREFSGSLFQEINHSHSTVNLLIGSKKFSEGWSSWRVSTMGLMNVGKAEGAQIIQLFGRGVRLKGCNLSLKRSEKTQLPDGLERPEHIGELETLRIFGIQADYMVQFRDFLEEEGLTTNDDRIEFLLPVKRDIGKRRLKTIGLKKTIGGIRTEFGTAFRKLAPIPTLASPDSASSWESHGLQGTPVMLNWYPKIQTMKSSGLTADGPEDKPNEASLTSRHVAFLDLDRLYFELERFKTERGWFNLNVTREGIEALLDDQSWYRLQIPEEELVGDSYEKVRLWEEVAMALLKKYTERYYVFHRQKWELPHLEYRALESDDPNFLGVRDSPDDGYRIVVKGPGEEIVAKLNELKAAIHKDEPKSWEFRGLKAVWFESHLYQPLLCLDTRVVEVSPAPLNRGERQFVEDLKAFHEVNEDFFVTRELYLLRNLSRGRGVGFFEAGNFHPDFILWLIEEDVQQIIFVDPKGLRNLGPTDPRIHFHKTVKDIEHRLGDPEVRLHSFIVSNTSSAAMRRQWDMEKIEMQKRHVLFQEEDRDDYIEQMLNV